MLCFLNICHAVNPHFLYVQASFERDWMSTTDHAEIWGLCQSSHHIELSVFLKLLLTRIRRMARDAANFYACALQSH